MHAVVFSGGGAKGIYQAYEFVKQLEEGLAPPDIVYGSSVGAINAAGYAYNGTKLLDIWRSIRGKADIMRLNWKFWASTGIFDNRPLRRLLNNHIKGPPICRAVTCHVDLITRKLSYVYNDRVSRDVFLDSIQASAAIPFAMTPVNSRVDGGIREVTPLHRAIQDGADTITVFLCDPYSKTPAPDNWRMPRGPFSVLEIGIRAIEIMEHEIFTNDIETCLYYNHLPRKKKLNLKVYSPRSKDMFIQTLDFDPMKIKRVIDDHVRMENSLGKAESTVLRKIA
jgi:NTE family protein